MTTVVHLRSREWAEAHPSRRVRIDRLTKWGNPFRLPPKYDRAGDPEKIFDRYRAYLKSRLDLVAQARSELKGKILGCWCHPGKCHGHILAAVADGAEP